MKSKIGMFGMAAIAVAIMGTATGCSTIYTALGTDAESVHNAAVEKVSEYAEKAVDKKIDASENLSEAGKTKLKAEVAKIKAEILEKIAEIKAKCAAAQKGDQIIAEESK